MQLVNEVLKEEGPMHKTAQLAPKAFLLMTNGLTTDKFLINIIE